ncbi:MAG: dUTP diphosphatase [Chitinophagaceae bacterium]|nr:dUTP diphosphatase [Chitinophagaceae bacterium]MCW5913234.1 dUTP diphosphatase [Chitinophagaceae bacterium]MCZ2397026.1 dUTP diphosphatase [Chitinophagales bacterium]
MDKLSIKIINQSGFELPQYATEGSSGMDLRAVLDTPLTLESLQRAMVPTGIFLEIPRGYEVQVRPRSGMAWKHGITCLNSPGTVDSDYRGELKVILVNLSSEPHTIQHGDRIAQMVVASIVHGELSESEHLAASGRGAGGFGHTGMK